ncbi:hypothetical protein CTAYLR_003933, partial [Chrysophaeum taylorii]
MSYQWQKFIKKGTNYTLSEEIPPFYQLAAATPLDDTTDNDPEGFVREIQAAAAQVLAGDTNGEDEEEKEPCLVSSDVATTDASEPTLGTDTANNNGSLELRALDALRKHLDRATRSSIRPDVADNIGLVALPTEISLKSRPSPVLKEKACREQRKPQVDSTSSFGPCATSEEALSLRKGPFACMCGEIMDVQARDAHLAHCQFFRDAWEAALRHFVASRGAVKVRRLISRVSIHRLCSHAAALCALVESKGDVDESVRKLANLDYRKEMGRVCDMHRIADFLETRPVIYGASPLSVLRDHGVKHASSDAPTSGDMPPRQSTQTWSASSRRSPHNMGSTEGGANEKGRAVRVERGSKGDVKAQRGGKRKLDGEKGGADKAQNENSHDPGVEKKRRFVWPDMLHAKFVSAVFDVGLRCSSAQTIIGTITRPGVDIDSIERLLGRYRTTRGVSHGSRPPGAEGSASSTDALCGGKKENSSKKAQQPLMKRPRDAATVLASSPDGSEVKMVVAPSDASARSSRPESVEDEMFVDTANEVFARSVAIARRQVEIALQSDELLRRFQGRLRATIEHQRELVAAIRSAVETATRPDLDLGASRNSACSQIGIDLRRREDDCMVNERALPPDLAQNPPRHHPAPISSFHHHHHRQEQPQLRQGHGDDFHVVGYQAPRQGGHRHHHHNQQRRASPPPPSRGVAQLIASTGGIVPPSDNDHDATTTSASTKLSVSSPVVKATVCARGPPLPRRATTPRPTARVTVRNDEIELPSSVSSSVTAGAINMLAMSCGDGLRQDHAGALTGRNALRDLQNSGGGGGGGGGGTVTAMNTATQGLRNGDARSIHLEMDLHMSLH